MAAQVALAAAAAIFSIGGGLVASAQAKDRAAFYAKQYDEQAKMTDMVYNRAIRKASGSAVADAAARGVGLVGSAIETVMDVTYSAGLEKAQKLQEIYMAKQRALISGQAESNQAISSGIGDALTTGLKTGFNLGQGKTAAVDKVAAPAKAAG